MWMLLAPAPPPDAPYWPGRRWLAALDAVAWPCGAWAALCLIQDIGGLLVAFVMALLAVTAARRLYTAVLVNRRYRFTTFVWLKRIVWVYAIAALLSAGVPS